MCKYSGKGEFLGEEILFILCFLNVYGLFDLRVEFCDSFKFFRFLCLGFLGSFRCRDVEYSRRVELMMF